jgi:uncharacterized protein (TIGR00255 family)
MSINSMTGFGRGCAEKRGIRVSIEMSAVNRKQLDLRLNMPRNLASLEPRIQKLVGSKLGRGHITATVNVGWSEHAGKTAVRLDMDRASSYVSALRAAAKTLNLKGDVPVDALLRIPDVMVCEDATRDAERVWPVLQQALKSALMQLQQMRATEGEALATDLRKRFVRLRKLAQRVEKRSPAVVSHYRRALETRIKAMKLAQGPSPEQLAREVALFADRCDISEELVRLGSHFDQVDVLLEKSEPVGRAFDFLCQEILREINTIGSKANDARLSQLVIQMKAEQESIREQVQNVE